MDETNLNNIIQVKFFTKQAKFAVANFPYSVPSTIELDELNNLINHLLSENDPESNTTHYEFDFIIHDKLLRSSIGKHLEELNLSTEQTIEIEYLTKSPAPQPEDCLLHDDWVSTVEIHGKWILTGCYDATLHLWTVDGKHKLVIPGHTGPIKSVSWMHLDSNTGIFVSGSHDQSCILWHWKVNENSVECGTVLRGHERGVEAVRSDPTGLIVASAGWDTYIKLWSATLDDSSSHSSCDEPSSKRIRTEGANIRVPLMTLQGHKEAVSGLTWIDKNSLCSASWDHTIRIWDTELGGIKREIIGNKAFFDIDYSKLNNLFVTSSADRHVRIYDSRSKLGAIVKGTYTSHTQWTQTVRWSDTNSNLFISGGHDGLSKLWDIRCFNAPLYDLKGHEDKILCCDWKHNLIVSGGADNTLRIFKQNDNEK